MQKMTHERTWSVTFVFQSTFSSFIIKLTSSTVSWAQGNSSVCHQYVPGTFMEILFYCTSLISVLLTGSQIKIPVPVVRSRSKFLFAPDQYLDRDMGGFLAGHPTSLSCLPPRHWEKSFTSPVRLEVRLNFRVFLIEAAQACQLTITRRNSVLSPLTKLPLH